MQTAILRHGMTTHSHFRETEQTSQALARSLPFWLRNMSEETIAPADARASARWQVWHQRIVDEILQSSFTATCTLHVLWTCPVEEDTQC